MNDWPGTVRVRVTPEVMETLFTRDYLGNRLRVDWGEPDADGFHCPTITVDYTNNSVAAERKRIRDAVEAMPTARIISQWDLISRKAVLAIIDREDTDDRP